MQKNAIVKSLESPDAKKKNVVIVEPLASMECASCSQACSKKRYTLPAFNKKGFDLKINSIVLISTSKKQEVIEGIISLFFPIIMAVTGFFLSNPIFKSIYAIIKKDGALNTVCPEGIKALIVFLFFALATLVVLIVTRSRLLLIYPEITDVIEPKN